MSNSTLSDGYGYSPVGLKTNLFYGIHITCFGCLAISLVGYNFSLYKLLRGKKLSEKLAHERFVVYYAFLGLVFTIAHGFDHAQMLSTQGFSYPRFVCGLYAFMSNFSAMGQLMLVIFVTGSVFLFVVMKRWMVFGKYDSRLMFYIIGVPLCGMGIIATRGKFGPDGLRCGFDTVKGGGDFVTFIIIPRITTFFVVPIMIGCIRFKLFLERRRSSKGMKEQTTEAIPNTLTNYHDDKASNSSGARLTVLQDIRIGSQTANGAVHPSGSTDNKTGALVVLEHDRLIAFLPYFALAFFGQWVLPVSRHLWDMIDPNTPLFIPLISDGVTYIGGVFTLMLFFKIYKGDESIPPKIKPKITDKPPEMSFKSNYEKWLYDQGLSSGKIQQRTTEESEENIPESAEDDESEDEEEKDQSTESTADKKSVRNESKQESNASTDEGFNSGETYIQPKVKTPVQTPSSLLKTTLPVRCSSSTSVKSAKISKKGRNTPAQISNSFLMTPVPERSSSADYIKSTKTSEQVSNSLLMAPLPDRCSSATTLRPIRNNEQVRPTSSRVSGTLLMTSLPDRSPSAASATTINERGPSRKSNISDDQLTKKCKGAQKRKKVMNGAANKITMNNSKTINKKEKIDDSHITKR